MAGSWAPTTSICRSRRAQDGGCFDGLMPTGLNRNQGAESILALQLANCAISGLGKGGAKRGRNGRAPSRSLARRGASAGDWRG